jgi:hypothetical protein
MKNTLSKLALAALLSLSAITANAATYRFDDVFTGSSSTVFTGPNTGYIDHTLSLAVANSDDSLQHAFSLFSHTTFDSFGYCSSGCVFTNTSKAGDKLFGTFTFTSVTAPDVNGDSSFAGNVIFTGGEGLFTGASGSGTFSGISNLSTLTTTQFNTSSITTPVPEADTSAMLLMGAGVMGFIARRRKQAAA